MDISSNCKIGVGFQSVAIQPTPIFDSVNSLSDGTKNQGMSLMESEVNSTTGAATADNTLIHSLANLLVCESTSMAFTQLQSYEAKVDRWETIIRERIAAQPTSGKQEQDVVERITEYLCVGGLFNPELMEHDKVRDLLMDCRASIKSEREQTQAYYQLWQDTSKSHRHDIDYLNKDIQQLREQLVAAQAKITKSLTIYEQIRLANGGTNDWCVQIVTPLESSDTTALDAERELADIGRKWKSDSSLETWFPFTAKEIQQLREQLAERHKLTVHYETKWKSEREKSRILGNMIDGVDGKPGLRDQLATWNHMQEVAKAQGFDSVTAAFVEIDKLRSQLAAAQHGRT